MKLAKTFLVVLATSAAVLAQGPPPPGGPEFGPRMMGGLGASPRSHRVVTGAPYTADMNSTQTRTLVDGNVIQHTMTGKVARDASGRTYLSETSTGGPLGQGPVTRISLYDPVAGYSYEIDPAAKTAVRRQVRTGSNANAAPSVPPERPANPNVVKSDLGTQTVNGVTAQGTSRTRTIPAGTIGNQKDIVTTSEVWYSPDLQVVVSSKFSDPRVGQSVYALTNIQHSADASLFQVPSGYTVSDAPKGGRGQFGRMQGPPPPPPQEF